LVVTGTLLVLVVKIPNFTKATCKQPIAKKWQAFPFLSN